MDPADHYYPNRGNLVDFFCSSGSKNCWHRQTGIEPTTRVTRCTCVKTASVLPKKRQLLNTAPQKSETDLQTKRQLVLFKQKKATQSSKSSQFGALAPALVTLPTILDHSSYSQTPMTSQQPRQPMYVVLKLNLTRLLLPIDILLSLQNNSDFLSFQFDSWYVLK